jgi:hypothetical protein
MYFFRGLSHFAIVAVALATTACSAQQIPVYPDTVNSNLPLPEQVELFNNAPGVVEPVLLPQQLAPLSTKCVGAKDSGTVAFSFVIDANGEPRNVIFKRAIANQIDLLALQILLGSRFQPAMLNGNPVAVGRDVEMHLEVCTEQQIGTTSAVTRLRQLQSEKFAGWNHSPHQANLAPLHMPADAQADHEKRGPDFTTPIDIAHRTLDAKGMSGSFEFGVLVDEHGLDHVEKVLKSTNPALLPVATLMIQSIRQTPAMKDGMPVPVHLTAGLNISSDN